mgnify:CR=1 FL=1
MIKLKNNTFLYQINVTRDCNLRCTHCYIHSDIKASSKKMNKDNILKIANDIVNHMKKIDYRHAEIHIVGGEPTMLGVDIFDQLINKKKKILDGHKFSYELLMK